MLYIVYKKTTCSDALDLPGPGYTGKLANTHFRMLQFVSYAIDMIVWWLENKIVYLNWESDIMRVVKHNILTRKKSICPHSTMLIDRLDNRRDNAILAELHKFAH